MRTLHAVLGALALAPALAHSQVVTPWARFGSDTAHHTIRIDSTRAHGERRSLLIASTPAANANSWNGARQYIDAAPFHGQRLRLTGYVRTEKAGEGSLYFRVEGFAGDTAVRWAYDDMSGRGVSGDNEWTMLSAVLDVPREATRVTIGALITGTGQLWVDDLKLEVVSGAVESTTTQMPYFFTDGERPDVLARWRREGLIPKPANLGFENR